MDFGLLYVDSDAHDFRLGARYGASARPIAVIVMVCEQVLFSEHPACPLGTRAIRCNPLRFYADQLEPPENLRMAQRTIRGRFLWLLNHTLNRVTSEIARSGRGPFSLIRHVGRKSGRTYETPVILARVPEGFIAELTYGENVNWYRNVLAGGACVVVHHRVEYHVNRVEPCDAERGRNAYPAPFRFILKAVASNKFRLLCVDDSQPAH